MAGETGQVVYYRVEVAARLAGVTPARLRRFEQAGLLRPAMLAAGRPLYGAAEIARLRKIRRLVDDLDINLAGVLVVLRLTEEIAALRAALDRQARLAKPGAHPIRRGGGRCTSTG